MARFLTPLLAVFLLGASPGDEHATDLTEVDDEAALMDEFALLQEEEIVLSAAKHKQKIGFSPSEVVVITRKDIEESGAATFMELLRRYPVVHVYEFDPIHPNIEIRNSKYVLLMIDGREVNLELFEAPFLEIVPVGIHDIERIEIVLGPNSALYGANAVAAVIHIMTRKPHEGLYAELSAAAGEHGGTILGGILGGGTGPWALQASFGLKQSLSWENRDLQAQDIKKANATFRLEIPDGSLELSGSVLNGGGRMYGVLGYMNLDSFTFAHAMANLTWNDLKVLTYWYGARTSLGVDIDLVHPDTGLVLARLPTADVTGDTFLLSAQYDLELFEDNLLIAGADVRYVRFESDATVNPVTTESRISFFVHDEHLFSEKLMLALSARFDYNSTTDMALSPRAALVYSPTPDHFIRLAGGTAFRKPTLLESTINLKVDAEPAFGEIKTLFEEQGISNPNLDNEILTAVEVGYRGSFLEKSLRVGADLYLSLNRETISFTNDIRFRPPPFNMQIDLANSKIGYGNIGEETNIVGAHFGVEGEPLEGITLFFRGNYRYSWFVKNERSYRYQPRFLGIIGGVARLPAGLVVHLSLAHVDYRIFDVRDPESSLAPVIELEIPAHTYMMAAVVYNLPLGESRLQLGLNIFNPFSGSFREAQGVRTDSGESYGGEMLDRRAMLTARLVY